MLESAVLPRIHPMRLRIAKPFDGPDYIFELKHDGFRALAYVEEGKCKLVSCNSNLLKSFQALTGSLGMLRVQNAILDGEIICIDGSGVSQFNTLCGFSHSFTQGFSPSFTHPRVLLLGF